MIHPSLEEARSALISVPRTLTLTALIGVPLVALDQWTKALITAWFKLGDSVPITSFFNLVLVYNKGAAFSFLSDAGGWQRPFFIGLTCVALVAMFWMLVKYRAETVFRWGLMLVVAGAIGNLIDRVRLGQVVDFLDFHAGGWHFWAFNVADSAITVGAALLIIDSFFGKKT